MIKLLKVKAAESPECQYMRVSNISLIWACMIFLKYVSLFMFSSKT